MDEVEYVVPPSNNNASGVTFNSNASQNTPEPPKKQPNGALEWVKSHKFLTTACVVMVGLVSLVSTALFTGQQVTVLGLQLNPLYNQASVCAPGQCPGNNPEFPDNPGPTNPGPTTPTTTPVTAPLGFQVTVRDNGCSDQERTSTNIGANSAGYVTDSNAKDPDCARIGFSSGSVNNIPATASIYSQDFRIGTRVAESENGCSNQIDAAIKWTPWASDGGGTSPQAVGTASSNDPDCIWLHYETRPMPTGKGLRDVRIGIASGGAIQFSPWARAGGGMSSFSTGGNIRPTSVAIEAQTISITPPVTTPISISGTIPTGIVNQVTSAVFTIAGGPQTPCTWSMTSITPAIAGATIVGSTASATFAATPIAQGVYQVAIRAVCQNGQTATITAPWTVNGTRLPPIESPELIITSPFNSGIVGQNYSSTIKTSGVTVSNCTWSLVSVVPAVSGASVTKVDNVADTATSSAEFRATPTVAGVYKVTASVICATGGSTQKTFDWVVGKPADTTAKDSCLDATTLGKLSAVYRFWSPERGDHLYTTNVNEKPKNYRFEGVSGYVFSQQMPNTVPIYRSAQLSIGSHYYTTANDDPTKYGYVDEGILGYAYPSTVAGASPWYRMHKGGATSDFVHTLSEAERNAIKELGYEDEGIVAFLCGGSQPTELQPLFRLWGANDMDHFYTTNFSERDALLTKGYVSEGITGYIYGVRKEGSAPLYRAYSRATGDHIYTASESEAKGGGYTYEGIIGYIASSDNAKTTPIYRLYNAAIGDHFYTASSDEATGAIQNGYKAEGITGYLYLSQ